MKEMSFHVLFIKQNLESVLVASFLLFIFPVNQISIADAQHFR